MATTTPDSLYFPVQTDSIGALHTILANMQNSNQLAFNKRQRTSYAWANAAARDAQTGMAAGSTGYQLDTKTEYIYNGTIWQISTPHAEFVAGGQAVGGATTSTLSVGSLDTTNSTTSTTVVGAGSSITIVEPGIYAVSSLNSLSTGVTGRAFLQAVLAGSGNVGRVGVGLNEDTVSVSIPNLRVPAANTALSFQFYHTNSGTITVSSRFRLTRLG